MDFGSYLVKNKIVDRNVLLEAQKKLKNSDVILDEVLLGQGVSEVELVKAKSNFFGIPIKKISTTESIPFDILQKIPEESVKHYKFVPLVFKDGVLEVGIVDPEDAGTREALQFLSSKLGLPFKIFLVSFSDLQKVLKDFKTLGGETVKILGELESVIAEKPIPEKFLQQKGKKGQEKIIEEAPVTKMVAVILRHAIDGNASDIHIEPQRDKLKVRFRVDGILHTSLKLPIKVHEAVVARVKILTNMKLDERRKPQDGRFETRLEGRHIDFRVSTFPTFFGEKVVIRILDSESGVKRLEETGLADRNLKIVQENLKKPYGLILITGPTGSGKTTTLYSMLSMLDREKFNVVSLEDPIEYNLEGVSQSQVRSEIDYNFANGLRSILRQDPDIIMVGEIRDKETARLAIQAALTGHLVFSTLHTNNTVGVVPRLIDMGIEPFLISATLLLAIAQRLVRTLCPDSKQPMELVDSVKEIVDHEIKDMPSIIKEKISMPKEIYRAKPSSVCPKGTSGRTGVYEVLEMTSELEKIILTKISESAIIEEARRQGAITMRQDGILKVLKGSVGLEELKEVI